MPHFVLRCYLASRLGYDTSNYLSRQELVTQEISLRNLSPNPNPTLSPHYIPKRETHWIDSKVLSIIDGSPELNTHSVHEIVNDEATAPIIGDKEIEHYLTRGNENNLVRTQLLVDRGNALHKSFE